jgi:hypothetical protein
MIIKGYGPCFLKSPSVKKKPKFKNLYAPIRSSLQARAQAIETPDL